MSKIAYSATAPDGQVYTRNSHRTYTHAVIYRWRLDHGDPAAIARHIARLREQVATGVYPAGTVGAGQPLSKAAMKRIQVQLANYERGWKGVAMFCGSHSLAMKALATRHARGDSHAVIVPAVVS